MKALAVIPARSGSKGLVNKNIRLLNGKPLLAYTIEAAIHSRKFSKVIVSTDSSEYAGIARQYGAKVPFLRAEHLATDTASSWDVVREVLTYYLNKGENFNLVGLLQPTSPLRTSDDIISAFDLFDKKKARSVVSVCEVDHSPVLSNVLPDSLSMETFISKAHTDLRRQELEVYYRLNGAIYLTYVQDVLEGKSLYNQDSYAYIMSKKHSVDIDEELDFKVADMLMDKDNKVYFN
ncbi:cytidylyltransferase domain-containing protein [Amphibacillus cookii]|uniref:acylneuraminate cytidylyltransferase family protein n=1 Tax=Amphibacillus cookii TaxID=767787 RepID=UPI0019565724|nr:acylneuraminate cytidylyltransferase family protein [Amphibacillus cookii]MBM7540036.1 CMP-N,N'-diacetyllegionaminic acid synthase [Amphibacillus cookii]